MAEENQYGLWPQFGETLSALIPKVENNATDEMNQSTSDLSTIGGNSLLPTSPLPTGEEIKEAAIVSDTQAKDTLAKDIQVLGALTGTASTTAPTAGATQTAEKPDIGYDVDVIRGTDRIRINSNYLTKYMGEGYQIAPPDIPPELMDNTQTPQDEEIAKTQEELNTLNQSVNDYISELDTFKEKISAESQGLIDSIKAQAVSRRNDMIEINRREKQTMETLGIRFGISRYSPILATDFISSIERAGMLKLAQIDADEAKLIMEAKQAQTKEEYSILHDKITLIKDLRDQKDKQLVEMQKEALKKSEKIAQKKIQSSRDASIANLISQGITDVGQILDSMNYDENGNQIGDITAEEVNNVLGKYLDNLKTQQSLTQSKGELKQLEDGEWGWIYPPTPDNPEGQIIKTGVKGKIADESLQLIRALTAEKLQGEIGGYIKVPETPENNLMINAFTSAVSDETPAKRQFREKQFSNLINSGNIEGAKEYILQTAMETADAETYKVVTGRIDSTIALQQVQSLLNEAEKAGINTGIVRGSIENLTRKLGTTTDPKLVDIGNRISYALFLYRKAMTGVQFGYAESGQYEKIFPNYKNNPPVNEAAISSLVDSMKSFNDSYFERKLGRENYQQLFGSSAVSGGTEGDPLGIR